MGKADKFLGTIKAFRVGPKANYYLSTSPSETRNLFLLCMTVTFSREELCYAIAAGIDMPFFAQHDWSAAYQ